MIENRIGDGIMRPAASGRFDVSTDCNFAWANRTVPDSRITVTREFESVLGRGKETHVQPRVKAGSPNKRSFVIIVLVLRMYKITRKSVQKPVLRAQRCMCQLWPRFQERGGRRQRHSQHRETGDAISDWTDCGAKARRT